MATMELKRGYYYADNAINISVDGAFWQTWCVVSPDGSVIAHCTSDDDATDIAAALNAANGIDDNSPAGDD